MHPDDDVKTYSLLQTMALIISSCAHCTWGERTWTKSRRHAGEEGRRGRHVQCEKVERHYVEEVIRSSRRGEEGEV